MSLSINQVVLVVENPPVNAGIIGDTGSIPGSGGGHDKPFHILAWRIPWREAPGGLQSMGITRVRHD